ncbi:MAG: hypothetical protein ACRDTC_02840 [Pseudonocardiaceae bacterium]
MHVQSEEQQGSVADDRGGHGQTMGSLLKGRKKMITAVFLFVSTTVGALVVHDLYYEAKNSVGSPFSTFVASYDECPQGEWLFPADFDLQKLPGFEQLNSRWAYENGGYSLKESVTELTFQAMAEGAVVLRDMRIEVIERKAPMKGFVVSKCPINMKPGLDVRRFEVDLDEERPSIVAQASQRDELNDAPDIFKGFPYKISQSEPEVFHLVAYTTNCSCLWRAELNWTAFGESGTETIGIGSVPFRTAAPDVTERFHYRPDGTLRKVPIRGSG